MNGTLIGKYRVLKQIGAGGMASVCLAVHQDIPSLHVVLKKLGDPDMVERFKREADKLAMLDGHPGICQIKHFFDHDGDFYIAMEYIDGVTLQDHVDQQGHLDLGHALYLARTILDVLETTHRLGICHRDIKPTNIMIDRHDNLKIIDFGLAKADSDPHLTSVGTSLGSPLYMAPEQFNPREDCDWIRCDIYAVGICLYFMLTGRLPFGGSNLLQIVEAKTKGEVPWPSTFNPDIPPRLEATILQAIARDPQERFASAADMKVALVSGPSDSDVRRAIRAQPVLVGAETVAVDAGLLAGRAQGASSPAPARPGGDRPGIFRRHRWRWLIPAALAAAAALVLAIAPGLFSPTGPPVDQDQAQEAGSPGGADSPDGPMNPDGSQVQDLSAASDRAAAVTDPGTSPERISPSDGNGPSERPVESPPVEPQTQPPATETTAALPAAAMGDLRVGTLPMWNAEIYIDGAKTKYTTPATLNLPAGEYLVKVVLQANGITMQREERVLVKAGELQKKVFHFE